MMPITVEFTVTKGGQSFQEDSVTLRNAEELFAYVAPGGGCEKMPAGLGEIQMMFLPAEHPNKMNPLADMRVNLQLGMVMMTGPFAEIVEVSQQLLDRVGRGELSEAFLAVIGANS